MKNLLKIVIIWCVLAMLYSCTNSDSPGSNDPGTNQSGFPSAKGKLTINGLSSFNGKYVYVSGLAGSSVLVGLTDITGYPSDITFKLAQISGGTAVVPLYMGNPSASSYSDSYIAYSGNDTITSIVYIYIVNDSSLKSSNASNAIMNNLGMKSLISGTFSNGNMSIDWGGGGNGNGNVTTDIVMVYVPGGSFQMGNPDTSVAWDVEKPVHTVTLTGFYMGKYPVTQAQYQAVMGSNPSIFSSNPASGEVQGNRPVEFVCWYDVIVFCNKLSIAENKSPAYRISGSTNPSDWGTVPTSWDSTWDAVEIVSGSTGYRLPTEAQWEYAAKGGNGTPGNYTFSGSNTIGDVAWYFFNSDDKTHEVGKKQPNGLGIYDMSGNVWEWCWDWYGNYSGGAQTDPVGAAAGDYRVVRGGCWDSYAPSARSVYRFYSLPYNRYYDYGFRLVRP